MLSAFLQQLGTPYSSSHSPTSPTQCQRQGEGVSKMEPPQSKPCPSPAQPHVSEMLAAAGHLAEALEGGIPPHQLQQAASLILDEQRGVHAAALAVWRVRSHDHAAGAPPRAVRAAGQGWGKGVSRGGWG